MTLPKLDSLSNEQIRVMIAEALGWKRKKSQNIDFKFVWVKPGTSEYCFALPNPTEDANAALTLCAWMAEKGWTCCCNNGLLWKNTFGTFSHRNRQVMVIPRSEKSLP